ncbi:MAG: phosphatidylglycerophosphatase A [Gammaproteobacteria bacterium]|nr:phosphatidylglycerophosphatase A [Gammaproteobacteria bacterium]
MARFVNALGYWLAVGFGSGLLKPAPGTWGSLAGALVFWGLLSLSQGITWALLFVGTVLGAWVCRMGGERLGEVDHGSIVWDEIIAMGWLLAVITQWYELTLVNVAIALVLFRVFDILKPFPINRVDAWHTPWGVMLDDLLAFAYAVICFFSLMYLIS